MKLKRGLRWVEGILPTYIVMRPDYSILGETEGLKSLAIVGCPACANYCLAYEKDEPVQKLITDETGSSSRLPVALMKEMNRLKGLLEEAASLR